MNTRTQAILLYVVGTILVVVLHGLNSMPQTQTLAIIELGISAIMAGGLSYAGILHLSNPDVPLPPATPPANLTELGHDGDHIFYAVRRSRAAKTIKKTAH